MNKYSRCLTAMSVAFTFLSASGAQETSTSKSIPRVMTITREYMKPGKAGAVHEKAESAFVQAMMRAKWPTHYLALTSLSGKSRALFLTRYATFEDWEKDNEAQQKNSALSAALDRAYMADGELLDSMDQGVFLYNEEMSLRPRADLSHMRFLEISSYRVRPGHAKDWRELVKLVKEAYEKGVPNAHWGAYEQRYGGEGGTYLIFTARTSLGELDRGEQDSKQFAAALGEEGMKKFSELYGAAVESSQHQLFAFNARMSYIYDEWAKSAPDFWKPKAATPAKAGAEEKKEKK